jgi:cobalt/nickel transport system permease protein
MLEEGFASGDSPIHRLDPRVRIVVAAGFSLVVATADRFLAVIPSLLLAACLVVVSKLPLKKVGFRLLIVNTLIALLWFFLPFTLEGEPLFKIGPLIGTREGICYVTVITLKSNAIVLALMALVATMSVFTVGRAMRHLRVPSKVTQLFFFTYRYIHVIHREYKRLANALKIRGFQPGTNMHTYRTYAYLVGMLLVKSHDRAERVRAAMLCRGYRGKFYDLSEFALKPYDLLFLVSVSLAVSVIGLLQWTRIVC